MKQGQDNKTLDADGINTTDAEQIEATAAMLENTDVGLEIGKTAEQTTDKRKNGKKRKKGRCFSKEIPTDATADDAQPGEIEIFVSNKKYKGNRKPSTAEDGQDTFAKFERIIKTPPAFIKTTLRKVKSTNLPSRKVISAMFHFPFQCSILSRFRRKW